VAAPSHSAARVALPAEAPSVRTQGYVVGNQAHGLRLDALRQHDGSNGHPVRLRRCVNVVPEQWNWVAP